MVAAIHMQAVSVPRPYYAVEIKVGSYALGSDISPRVSTLLVSLVATASAGRMTEEVFLQSEYVKNGRSQLDSHIREWMPESGLGVWPDRAPPELWKLSDIFRMALGESVPLMNRVDRVTAGAKANEEALQEMLPSGMVMTIVHSGSTDDLLRHYKDAFLPRIKEPNLRIFPFYVPLLDLNSLRNCNGAQLGEWLGGAHLYLRESPADHAVLIISSQDPNSLLTRAGARTEGNGHWEF
jgi:hypothetical protein